MVTKAQAEENPIEYLGRDIFLSTGDDVTVNSKADLSQVRYYDNLTQAIVNRLRTAIGELHLHPDYGCRLHELIGTNPSQITLSLAKMHVRESLLQEARIDTVDIINPYFREGTNQTVIDINITVTPIKELNTLDLVYSVFI